MKILVTGGSGQLGRSLVKRGHWRAHEIIARGRDMLDIGDRRAVEEALQVDVVINAAAYTAVDRAETERDQAFAINARGAANLARACAVRRVPLLHVSTDYVFDGTATRPYREDDPTAPSCVYGQSKAEGEIVVRDAGGTVIRTSWLFAARGPGFVQTMLRLAAERRVLCVVGDQHGCPTWAEDLADALLELAERPERDSIYHYCGEHPTTWHAFACAIIEEARRHRTLACERVDAITTSECPMPARRPAYSVLDTTRIRALGIVPAPWRTGLARVIAEELGGPS